MTEITDVTWSSSRFALFGARGLMGYEVGEREQLCDYVNAALEESGIDLEALEGRNGIEHGEIAGEWRY